MKKILFSVLAALSATTLTFAATEKTVDCGSSVTITATEVTGHHFVKWVNVDNATDEQTANPYTFTPTADVTYKAIFAIDVYTITFTDAQGEISSKEYEYNSSVVIPTAREKAGNAQYTWTFKAWRNTATGIEGVESKAIANANYEAVYESTVNKYTITFKNWDGTVLQSSEVEYGKMPEYTGTPTRPNSGGNSWTFAGWDNTLVAVTGEAVYTATYIPNVLSFELKVTSNNTDFGTVTGSGTFAYGSTHQITATAKDCYRFVKWSDGDTNPSRSVVITDNETTNTYQAIFEKITYTIKVIVDDASVGKGTVKIE